MSQPTNQQKREILAAVFTPLANAAPGRPTAASGLKDAKPCPFCGSEKIVKGERYFALCVDCGATGPERNADASERKFVGDWNTRKESQAP